MRALAIVALLAGAASADPVNVRVVEVAGGAAYVTPGRAAGLVPGTIVRIGARDFTIVEVTDKSAMVRADGIDVGDTGVANVDRTAPAALDKLAKPRPAEAFRGQWPDAVKPAETQNPTEVPLGAARQAGRARVTVIGHGYAVAAKGGSTASGEGRVIASFDLLADRPLAADVDVAGRLFSEGYDRSTHTPLFVRAAQLRYGSALDPNLALGRLRFAASSLGMLDGARAAYHIGAFELAGFGGLVPDPLSGKPDTSTSRFGTELVYDAAQSAWQPRVAVVAYGSTWQGKLDERRLSVVATANRSTLWLDTWAEAQQFPSDNPWQAHAVELTGAGGTAEWREHGKHAGVDIAYLRPERSLRLAALLPPSWLCTLAPQPGDVAETCAGGDAWVTTSASAGIRTSRYALDGVATVGESQGIYRGYEASGYARGELRAGDVRFVLGGSGGHASFATWIAGEGGLGARLLRRLDAVVTYRPELLDYHASTGPMLLHSLVMDGYLPLSRSLDLAGSAVATTGADRTALAMLATFIWRPLP